MTYLEALEMAIGVLDEMSRQADRPTTGAALHEAAEVLQNAADAARAEGLGA